MIGAARVSVDPASMLTTAVSARALLGVARIPEEIAKTRAGNLVQRRTPLTEQACDGTFWDTNEAERVPAATDIRLLAAIPVVCAMRWGGNTCCQADMNLCNASL